MPKTKGKMAEINPFEVIAFAGFLVSLAQAVQLVSISILGVALGGIAPYLAIIFLMAGYVAGEVRSFGDMVDWEYITLGVTGFFLISIEYIPEVSSFILGNEVYSLIVFGVSAVGFVVLALRRDA